MRWFFFLLLLLQTVVKIHTMATDPKPVQALDQETIDRMNQAEHSKPGVILDEDGNELTDADFWDGTGEPYWIGD